MERLRHCYPKIGPAGWRAPISLLNHQANRMGPGDLLCAKGVVEGSTEEALDLSGW